MVVDQDLLGAIELANTFSSQIWMHRDTLHHRQLIHSVQSGIDAAEKLVASGKRPVVLLEHADRMNNSTYILREVLHRKLQRTVVPYLWDPLAVAEAVSAGVGATISLTVGGRSTGRAGGAVLLEGKIVHAGQVTYRATGPYGTGSTVDLGLTAVMNSGSALVSLTSLPNTAVDDDCLTQFGRSLDEFDFVVLRSKTHFRAFFEPVSAAIFIIDTPDWGAADLRTLPYRRVPIDRIHPFVESEP